MTANPHSHATPTLQHVATAALMALATFMAAATAAADNVLAEGEKAEGFKLLFDGTTLNDWDGNRKLWTVQDGAIVGQTTRERGTTANSYLVWKGGAVSDFELRFQFRLSGGNGSGVLYRGKDLGNGVASGYQYDIESGPEQMGKLCDEKGKRGRMAMGGEKVTWAAKKSVTGTTVDKEALSKAEKTGDWNDGTITAKGNHIVHTINGVTVVDCTDEDESSRLLRGIVGLQIRGGSPMKIEFKNIRLRELGTNLGVPYDPTKHGGGPFQRNLEIASLSSRSGLYVFWVDQESKAAKNARGYCMLVKKEGNQYAVANAFGVELLHSLLGFTMDEQGCFYVATGLVEAPESLPKPPTYRSNVVNILKLSPQGKLLLTIDVQKEMEKADPKTTIIQDPGTHGWSSSRLAYGNGTLHIVFGVSWTNGHQGACAAQFDSATGGAVRLGSTYCSHCMDQRVVWDGTMFLEMLMGDTFPRAFVMGRYFRKKSSRTLEIFNPKAGGQQHSFMGNIVATADPMYGYLTSFAIEKSPDADSYHELAVARVRANSDRLDANPATKAYVDQTFAKQSVKVEDKTLTNYVKWMTDASKDRMHVARPKLVRVDTDRFVMLWEKWAGEPGERLSNYSGTYGMVIDSRANVIAPEKKLADAQLVTGDDGVFLVGKAVFVSGNAAKRSVRLLGVDKDLNVESAELPAYKY